MRAFTDRPIAKGLATAIVFAASTALAAERELVDRVVAVIEDQIVTQRELDERVAPYLEQLEDIPDPEKREARRKEIQRQVLDIEIGERMVDRELERNRDKLGVTDAEIDETIDDFAKENNLTRDQLQAALYGQGMTWSEYRKKMRDQLERMRLMQMHVQGKVQVKDADVKRRCEERARTGGDTGQVCASHILVAVPEKASAAEVEKLRLEASRLQAELAKGADFAAYAREHSDDKGAPDGTLGCFARGEMVKPFEDAAFGLEIGQISPVVRTRFGFHVIKLNDRVAAAKSSASCESGQALARYRNELYQEEMERQMNAWIAELRRKAFVEVRL